ncbi:MAG: acyl-CoA dehydratase activase, partial [Candidatus Heimdallarchaeota archaeon]
MEKAHPQAQISVLYESSFYEAYGTALLVSDEPKFRKPKLSVNPLFNTLGSLKDSNHLVTQIHEYPAILEENQETQLIVMGIDGGSTTTKITLLELPSRKLLASHYTRTNGDPLNATKECIEEIQEQYGNNRIDLISTTGSAREIIAAFIGTSAVYNEISAHTAGAVSFESEVDTIFEIGGQDAKYIYLENGSPIDYAMNSACSAGTGSFLEECAKGDLGISVYDISNIALHAQSPVLFKADCAAFINSDIRTALQEGYTKEDIIGGLVSSIVNNYLTKVKGPRKVGKKIFLQGGVAKNKAIAFAFAQATGKEIIIPPNPELTGAYGVALMAYQRYQKGTLDLNPTSPKLLLGYEMQRLNSFICRSCDMYCSINRYQVGDRKFPFGGKCSKYESKWKQLELDHNVTDFVEERNKLIFSVLNEKSQEEHLINNVTIGIPRALTTHFLLPLYYTFLKSLGFQVVLSGIDSDGELTVNAPFCFPTQIAHGAVLDLIRREENNKSKVDYVFFPQVQRMPHHGVENAYLCPITQASPFILKKAFSNVEFLSPSIDFIDGYESDNELISYFEREFNIPLNILQNAYLAAIGKQQSIEAEMMKLGKRALELAISEDKPAILLVGRSYNAFPNETSQSIGRKLSSKGIITIPYDCLGSSTNSSTTWYFSNLILDAVKLAKKHDNLFILYISNFGCSIDSFTQEYLRREMNSKPYLKLEIDSHSADAGTQTRLEAFLDIIQ